MKKKLSLFLILLLLFTSAVCVSAENGIDGRNEDSITISYTVNGNYEISIPPSGSGNMNGKSGLRGKKEISIVPLFGDEVSSFKVEVKNVLLEAETMLRISVRSENRFSLVMSNGVSVPYVLTGADEDGTVLILRAGETSGEKTLTMTLGDTSGLNYAGSYYDKLTFDCEILEES